MTPPESSLLQAPPAAETFARLIRQRRATRHFTDEPVPEAALTQIFADAAQAPSGYNLQPWRFLVLRHPANRELLRSAAFGQEKITEAPVVVVAYAPHHEWRERIDEVFAESVRRGAMPPEAAAESRKAAEKFIDTLPLPVWLNRQVMIAFTHLMLSAEAHGFDTAPMEGFDGEKVKTVCKLPLETEVIALLAIGRSRDAGQPFPGRFDVARLVADERPGNPWVGSEPDADRPDAGQFQ